MHHRMPCTQCDHALILELREIQGQASKLSNGRAARASGGSELGGWAAEGRQCKDSATCKFICAFRVNDEDIAPRSADGKEK